jgi:hypothetical protein
VQRSNNRLENMDLKEIIKNFVKDEANITEPFNEEIVPY